MNYDLTFIHLNGTEEVAYPLTIYRDDTIDNVKSKLSQVLDNKNIDQYYLFAKKKTLLNPYDMYKKLSFQNTKEITYEVFSSFCLNHELPIPEKKESYELDDFLELETSVNSMFPIGIVHDTPFVVNPFQNELNQLEDSGTSSKQLWISLPDILENKVYVCFSEDVSRYSLQEGLEISNVFNVYYPYLFSHMFKEQPVKPIVSYDEYNQVIDFHHRIYKPESILSDGITSLYFVMYTLQPFQFPLDIFFKIFQSTVKYPYIKLNGIKTNENIYRFYCNQYSENGHKLPYLKKRTILKYARVINKNSISYLFYYRDIPIYLILDKKGHMYFHLDQIPFLSIQKIEEILKHTLDDFTNKLLEYFDPSHKIFTPFEHLHQPNISILDMKYKCIYPKEGRLNVKKYMTCLSPLFNFIEEKDKITLRYKRVSNYNESQSKDAYLIESFNKNIPIEEIIQVFSANFMKQNDKAAADYVQAFFSTIEIEEKQNNLRRVKINPGFLVEIEKKENLEVTVHFIDNIQYIPFIRLYVTNLILISQGIVSDNGTCKKVQEIKIVEIRQEAPEEDDVEFRMDDELEEIDEPVDMEALPDVSSEASLNSSLSQPNEDSVALTEPSVASAKEDSVASAKEDSVALTEPSVASAKEDSVALTEPSVASAKEDSIALTEPSVASAKEDSVALTEPSVASAKEDSVALTEPSVASAKENSVALTEPSANNSQEGSVALTEPSANNSQKSSVALTEPSTNNSQEGSVALTEPSANNSQEGSVALTEPSANKSQEGSVALTEPSANKSQEGSVALTEPSANKSQEGSVALTEPSANKSQEGSVALTEPSANLSEPNATSYISSLTDSDISNKESLSVPSISMEERYNELKEGLNESSKSENKWSMPTDESELTEPSRGGMQAEEKKYEVFIYDENDPSLIIERFNKKPPFLEGVIHDYFRAFQGNECTLVKKEKETCKGYVVEMNEAELETLMNGAKRIPIEYFDKPGNSYDGVTYIRAQKEWPEHPTVQFVKKVYASVSYGWKHKQDDKDEMFIYDIHNELKARYNGKYYVKLDEGDELIKIKFSPVNPLLKRLQDREPELFTKTDSIHNQYSRMCPWSEKRQPVILTKEEKERIDEIAPGSYDSVIEYGLGEKKPYYYICPRYWDLKNNVPVSPDKVDPDKLISRNASDSEKQKHIQSRYILELAKPGDTPTYQTRVGFLTKKSPSGHYMPCCFISKPKKDKPDALDKRIQEALQYYQRKPEETKEKDSEYILDGIKFPLPENRMGHLPIILELFFNVTFTDCYSQLQKKKLKVNYPCLLRQGVSERQPFLASLSFLYFKKNMPLDAFLEVLYEKVTLDTIQTFHNGGLVHTFSKEEAKDISPYRKTKLFKSMGDTSTFKRIVNGYENFCNYLSSEDYIDYTYLWDIVTMALFQEKVNMVILKEGLEDSTNNMTIVCPTTSHAIYSFDENNPSIMIYQKGTLFEPLFIYKKMTDEKNKTITKFDLREKIPSVHDILKKIHDKMGTCKETTIHKSYRFKENLYLHELLDELKKIKYTVNKEIMNIDGRIFGVMVSKSNKPFFVPCLPSAVSGDYELLDDSLWHNYRYTVSSLKKLEEDSNHKIPCSPKIRVLENHMVVGILTETNQFIPLKEPEENKMKDELKTLEEKNHLRVDEAIQRGDIQQKERVIQHLKVEQMFYNAFFNTLKVELNDSKYINVRKKIERAISVKDSVALERLFQPILNAKFLFVDKYDIDVSSLETINLCKDSDEPYCGTLKHKGKLLIPKINLFNRTDNEESYKNRFIDDLMMNVHIQRILFEEIHSTLYYTDRYTLSDHEILLLESELNTYLEQEPVKTIVSAVHPMIEDVSPSKIMEYANSIEPEEEAEKIPFPNGDEELDLSDESDSDKSDTDSDSDSDSDGKDEPSVPNEPVDQEDSMRNSEESDTENKPTYGQKRYLPENLESLGLSDTDEDESLDKERHAYLKNLGLSSNSEEAEQSEAEETEQSEAEETEQSEAEEVEQSEAEEAEQSEAEEAEQSEAEEVEQSEAEEAEESENVPLEPVNYASNSEAETVPVYARNKNSSESNVPPLESVEYETESSESAESLQRRISENKKALKPSTEKAQSFVKKAKELYRRNNSPANENALLEAQEHLQALQPKKLNKFKRIEADILPCIKTFYFKKNSKWKDYFPTRTIGFRIMKGKTYDTAIPDVTCNFMMALQILKTYKEAYATITIRDLKEMLITGYKHLSSTIDVLGKKFKKEKKRFKKWEDIQMETYPFTQLDLIVLMIEYKLPVVIFIQAKKKIKLLTYQTEDRFNYYIKMKKKDVFMFFIYNKDFQIEKDDMESLYQAERDIVYLNDPQQLTTYLTKY